MDDLWYFSDQSISLSDLFLGKQIGDYIIRPSQTVSNAFTLVVKEQLFLVQVRIITNKDGYFSFELPSSEITRSLLMYSPLELKSKNLHCLICKLKKLFETANKPCAISKGIINKYVQLNMPIQVKILSLKHNCRIIIIKEKLSFSTLPLSLQMYINDYLPLNEEL